MIDFNTFQYRGYTITQLDEMIDFYKQHRIAPPSGSIQAEVSKLDWESFKPKWIDTPQSISVEVRHEGYVYRGTAHLVSNSEE